VRVLAIGSMYPPHYLGGQEVVWRRATLHQRAAGHEVRVLTTDYRRPDLPEAEELDDDVHRELRWWWRDHEFPSMGLRERLALERHNAAVLDRHLAELRPDAVIWWSQGGMSLSLVERVRQAGVPALGVVGDDWMLYGPRVDLWTRVFARRPWLAPAARLTGIPVRFEPGAAARWLFVSESVRGRALRHFDLPDTGIVHPGIDPAMFPEAPPGPWRWRLAYVGRIDPRKGIDIAIRALPLLPEDATLAVVGAGDDQHRDELRALAAELGLGARVAFSQRPREELQQAYADADAIVFPVTWEEPWGLVPIEAMAVGRPVVATGRGGSGEYLREGENCLLFDPDDGPEALGAALRRLAGDERLRERLLAGGRDTAAELDEARFNETVMTELEALGRRARVDNRAA
jgi:glycosyltransferase involved in cell wall biosynthesis